MKPSRPVLSRLPQALAAVALAGAALLGGTSAADADTPPFSAAAACHWADGLPTEVLRWGSTGSCVRYLQDKLAVSTDGIFGRETYHAVVITQDHCGLRADGIVGPKTWDALLHWCRE